MECKPQASIKTMWPPRLTSFTWPMLCTQADRRDEKQKSKGDTQAQTIMMYRRCCYWLVDHTDARPSHSYIHLHVLYVFSTTWRFPSGDFLSWCRLEISSGLLKLRHDPHRTKRKPAPDNDVVNHWFAWGPELLSSPLVEPKIKTTEIYDRHIFNPRCTELWTLTRLILNQ